MTGPKEARPRRRVVRGEGEVTEWPRGLLAYVPTGPEDSTPSPEEDRTRNRVLLASRLISLLRSRGDTVDRELAALHRAERALRANDPDAATREVEDLLAELGRRAGGSSASRRTA